MPGKEIITSDGEIVPHEPAGGIIGVEESRAVAESQAGFVIAKRFPRDREAAKLAIKRECESVRLAEEAEYSYKKGNKNVQGPTIRLLEVVAQNWGNVVCGIRELEVRDEDTLMQAFAYDLETNMRDERMFTVPNFIKLRDGSRKYLDDPRELYELRANMGSRRKRACLEAVIPRHIIEEAVEICRETERTKGTPVTEENIAKLIEAFAEIGVTEDMLERRQQKKMKALTGPELRALRRIYKGIDEGMTTADKEFGEPSIQQPTEVEPEEEEPKKKKKKAPAKKAKKKEPEPESDPSTEEPAPEPSSNEPPEPEPSPSPEPSENMIQDRIEKVDFIKEGQGKSGPWKLYNVVTASGEVFACFDEKVIEGAESCADNGYVAELEYRKTKHGNQLISLDILG